MNDEFNPLKYKYVDVFYGGNKNGYNYKLTLFNKIENEYFIAYEYKKIRGKYYCPTIKLRLKDFQKTRYGEICVVSKGTFKGHIFYFYN